MFDLLIRNALIYDGSGNPAFTGNVAVSNGKIVAVGADVSGEAKETVDAAGLSLAPGFIDVHSHSDQVIHSDPHRLHVLRMGVTTEIAGQCGGTMSPASENMTEETRASMKKQHSPLYATMKDQLKDVDTLALGPNQRYFLTDAPLCHSGTYTCQIPPSGSSARH